MAAFYTKFVTSLSMLPQHFFPTTAKYSMAACKPQSNISK